MSASNRIVLYLFLARYLCLITGTPGQFDTYNDDEDLTQYTDLSGSGDYPNTDEGYPKETKLTIQAPAINMTAGNPGPLIELSLFSNSQIKLQDSQEKPDYKNITLQAANVNVNERKRKEKINSFKNSDKSKPEKKTNKVSGSERSPKRQRKKKKVKKHKKKQNSVGKNKPNRAKTVNLGEPKSSQTILIKSTKKRKPQQGDQTDFHIRRNIVSNKHQHSSKHRNRHHNKGRQRKRWRKNMDSNSHGYGSKSTYRKRKLTFEDRWPGCFKKYESCYRDSNCCNSNCQQFSWLSFGFCL